MVILSIFFLILFLVTQNYLLLLLSGGLILWWLFNKYGKIRISTDEDDVSEDSDFLNKLITLANKTTNKAVRHACDVIITYLKKEQKEKAESGAEAEQPAKSAEDEKEASHGKVKEEPLVPEFSINFKEAFTSLNNINIFLYLGAFFIVVAAGIFVSFTYEQLSGVTKTLLLAFFALTFYITGLLFYLKTKRIRPAGLAFTGIGLVLIPLVGLGAYNFIFQGANANYVWFFTSVITLAFYVFSVFVLRKTYIAYLMTFTSLSLIESSLSLFNVPVYYFTWGMAIVSMTFLVAGRYKHLFREVGESFRISANIFLPASLIFSFYLTNNYGAGQLGINFILSALFYILASFLTEDTDSRDIYFALGLCGIPAGFIFFLRDYHFSDVIIAHVLALTSAVYVYFTEYAYKNWKDRRTTLLSLAAGIVILFAVYYSRVFTPNNYFILVLSFIINGYGMMRTKHVIHEILGTISFIVLLFLGTGVQTGHTGIVLMLASGFYFYIHTISDTKEMKHIYFTLSLLLFPAGIYFWMRDFRVDTGTIAFVLTLTGFVYVGILEFAEKFWTDERISILSLAGGLLSVIAVFISKGEYPLFYVIYALSLIRNVYGYWRVKSQLHVALGSAAFIISISGFGVIPTGYYGIVTLLVTVFMTGIFFLTPDKNEMKNVYLTLSLILFPVGIYFLLQDYQIEAYAMALILCAIGISYAVLMEVLYKKWSATRIEIFGILSGLLTLTGVSLVLGDHAIKVFVLFCASLVNAYCFFRTRNLFHVIAGQAGLLWLPQVIFENIYPFGTQAVATAVLYVITAVGIAGLRKYLLSMKMRMAAGILAAGYVIGFGLGLYFAYASGNDSAVLLIFLATAIIIFGLSYFEKEERLIIISVILFYLATMRIVVIGDFPQEVYSLQLALSGIVLFGAGHMFEKGRNKILRFSGISGAYLGALYNLPFGYHNIQPILALYAAGGMSYAEAGKEKSTIAKYVSSGVIVLATEWLYYFLNIDETQVYTVTWALYFGGLAYLRYLKRDKESQDILTYIALAFLTIPLAWQALSDQKYALFLILEGLGLVAGGVAINYKLVKNWGLVALVGTVIYQLRDFFLGLPSWAVFGLIGILILGGSVFLLSRRKE